MGGDKQALSPSQMAQLQQLRDEVVRLTNDLHNKQGKRMVVRGGWGVDKQALSPSQMAQLQQLRDEVVRLTNDLHNKQGKRMVVRGGWGW